MHKPILFVDIDGVLSLFGFAPGPVPPDARFVQVDGMPHFLSQRAADNLLSVLGDFEPVWCTGWEDRANDHLPHVLGLGPWPYLQFGESAAGAPHWKLPAVEAFAGARACAWIDDGLDGVVRSWAARRLAPTLLIETDPPVGLTAADAERLRGWAGGEARAATP
ncbi:MAG TPA: hypothetical protein VIL64_03545 [Solirubrobacteraceae bacterium]